MKDQSQFHRQTKKGDILPNVLHPCEDCKREFLGVKFRKYCPDCSASRDRETRRLSYERKKLGISNPHPIRHRTIRLRVNKSKVTIFNFKAK